MPTGFVHIILFPSTILRVFLVLPRVVSGSLRLALHVLAKVLFVVVFHIPGISVFASKYYLHV